MKSLLLLAALGLLAAPADKKSPEPARTDDSALEYAIGPKDLLEIRVLEIPDMNGERRVSETGGINLPVLGDVAVSGLSGLFERLLAATMAAAIAALAAGILRRTRNMSGPEPDHTTTVPPQPPSSAVTQ